MKKEYNMQINDKNYYYYRIARNKAWEILIYCEITSLPLDLKLISNYFKIKIIPYSRAKNYKNFTSEMKKGDGFSAIINSQKIIYFNDRINLKERIRFTIAHELGHCLLGHDLNKQKYRNSEIDLDDNTIEEMQANVFARDILMPAVVLHYTNNINYEDIMKFCGISETSAKIREERMKILEARNKFCLSPLEKQVYTNFSNFIKTYKK